MAPPDRRKPSVADLSHQFSLHCIRPPTPEYADSSSGVYSYSNERPIFSCPSYEPRSRPADPIAPPTPPSECSTPISPFSISPYTPIRRSSTSLSGDSGCMTPVSSHSPIASPPSTYATMSTQSIRQQRQRAVRQMCTTAHLEEVRKLVSRMVERGDLREVSAPGTDPVSKMAEDDDMIVDDRDLPQSTLDAVGEGLTKAATFPAATDRRSSLSSARVRKEGRHGRRSRRGGGEG